MRYGTCGNLTATGPDKTGIETLEKLKAFGYDYIELPLGEMMALSQLDRDEIAARVDRSGLKSEVINNFFPRSLKLTGPAVDKQAVRDYYRKSMPYAKRLGAEYVIFGSPFAKSYPLGFSKEAALEQLEEWTVEVDAFAQELGLRILVEPIHSYESNLINTFAEGVALVQKVQPKVTDVLVDFYHMTRDHEDPAILLQHGKQYLRHIHWACPFHPGEGERVFPLDVNEWEPYKPFVKVLKEIGYDGRISIEARTTDYDAHAPKSLAVLKELFR